MKLLMGVRAAPAEMRECEPKPANAWSWVCGGDCETGGTGETSGKAGRAGVAVGYFSGV